MKNEQKINEKKLKISIKKKPNNNLKTNPSEINFEDLFDLVPVGYFILDVKGNLVNVNKTGVKLFASTKIKMQNKNLSVFIHQKKEKVTFSNYIKPSTEKIKPTHFKFTFLKEDGSLFYGFMEILNYNIEKGKTKYFLFTIVDISAQKKQEHLLATAFQNERELNEMKSQFVSIVSHEFRTPLSTILTSAELIEKYNKPEDFDKKEKHFIKIKTSVKRIKELLMDFLSIEEFEKNKINNTPETFNLVEFIKDKVNVVKQFNGQHSHTIKHIGKYQDVCLDRRLLKTCLTNLLVNAYKYSEPVGGKIEIITEQKTLGNIKITIKDNGIGIPVNDQKNIFKRFFRAKNAENIEGTGVGLNITKDLVNIMGGTISFVSSEKKGTSFVLNFSK